MDNNTMNNTFINMTKTDDNTDGENRTFVIVMGILLAIIVFYYFCNRNERRDRIDMEERASRAQARLEIRYGK
ncbi:MAG: hypothetical protein CMD14_09365 [Flavobacteriales bacterium]|nr:hypothetical protein [Flavobacteriales bacterium]